MALSLTHPPSLVISLRWLSEHTAITEVATQLLYPASVCVCMCVCSTAVAMNYGNVVVTACDLRSFEMHISQDFLLIIIKNAPI